MNNLEYMYINLNLKFGDNWRSIFTILHSVLNGQRSIPIIFKRTNTESTEPTEYPSAFTPEVLLKTWTFIGGYSELEASLDDLDLSVNSDY